LVSAPLTPWDTGSAGERIDLDRVVLLDVSLELSNGERSSVNGDLTENGLWVGNANDGAHGHNIILLGLDLLGGIRLGE
jgi:hypothetical protein